MASAGIYKRKGGSPYWWIWWTTPVKDPRTGKIRLKKRYESTKEREYNQHVKRQLANKIKEADAKPKLDLPDITYEDARDLWLKHREVVLTGKGRRLDRLTDGRLYFAGRKYLDPFFAGWLAKNIDTPDIERLQSELLALGLGNGIDRMVAALRAMLRYAVEAGRLVKEQLPHRFPMLRKPRQMPETIDERFFEPLRKALPEPYKGPFALAYWSGMRLSEVERLRWSNVHLAKKTPHLHFLGAKVKPNEDERKYWRRVPLLKEGLKVMRSLKAGLPGDLVFPQLGNRTESARVWRKAAVAVGLGYWHCRKCTAQLRDLVCPEHGKLNERRARYVGPLFRHTRHTFIHTATNRGIPIARIMQATGHKHLPTHMGYNEGEETDLVLFREAFGD